MKTIKLLLIEDDENLSYILKSSMEDVIGGYEVEIALSGEVGLELYESFNPDVIVSDIMMQKMDEGLEMVKKIRQKDRKQPIIFATAKDAPKELLEGYQTGANLYVKKPYTPHELDAHIKALLNTIDGSRLRLVDGIRQIGKYTFEHKNLLLVYSDSDKIRLTARESNILEILSQHKGELVEREYMLKKIWGEKNTDSNSHSLNVFITKLRKYLSKDPSITITNVKPVGLKLDFD